MIRTGIFGTSYIADARRHAVVRLWIQLAKKLDPGFPLFIADSASPLEVPDDCMIDILRFDDNLGHLASGGGDGWGRGFCKCIEKAIYEEFDYVAIVDTDIILCRPVGPIFDQMRANGWKVAMPIGHGHSFADNGLFFADVAWLKEIDFVARYDWRSSHSRRLPELHCQDICGPDLHILDLPGRRNDKGDLTTDNLAMLYPAGCAWLTHCVDTSPYAALLRLNGIDPTEIGWETV